MQKPRFNGPIRGSGYVFASVFAVLLFGAGRIVVAQSPSGNVSSPASSSAIIPVIVTDKHTNAPVAGLTSRDLVIDSERSAIHVSSIVNSSAGSLRPLAVWFVYQCPQAGIAFSWVSYGSGFMKGKSSAFTPVLQKLGAQDTVGVAHWCDDGTLSVDLPPTLDRSAPSAALEEGLSAPMKANSDQPGQNALHDVFLRIRELCRQTSPGSLPVFIFLYGDHSGMYHQQVSELLDPSLGPMPIVYGINNGAVSIQPHPITSQYTQLYVVHFLSEKTGGQVYSSFRGNYGEDLEKILKTLQGRYELAFDAQPNQNKLQEIKVKFSDEARKTFKSADLRFPSVFGLSASGNAAAGQDLQASLLSVLHTGTPFTEVAFDASCKKSAMPDVTAQCRLYVDPHNLTWVPQEKGDAQCELTLVTAAVSTQGNVVGSEMRKFQAVQNEADRSGSPKAVILMLTFPLPENSARLQFVLRDQATSHLGSFSLAADQIRAAKNP
jgi:hypothetical protein